jgi:hypothetical protein
VTRIASPLLVVLVLACCAGTVRAASLERGAWLSVKGRPGPSASLEASSIEPSEADEIEIRGRLSMLDFEAGSLRIGPVAARLDENTDFDDEKGRNLPSSEFAAGDHVKVTLEPLAEGGFRVEEVKKRAGSSEKIRIDAPVDSTRPLISTDVRFRMLGLEIVADDGTDWEGGLRAPRLVDDDEDARPSENISLGPAGTLSGEVRLDLKGEDNFDLALSRPDDLETARLRAEFEWTFPSTESVEGMLELRAQSEWVLHDELGDEDAQDESLRLGETWVAFKGLFDGIGRLELGRNRWDDGRDWWYRANLDSIRLNLDWERVSLQLAVAEQLLDPPSSLEDVRHHLLRLELRPASRHELALIVLDRRDRGAGDRFEPLYYGLHAEGRFAERFEYRFDYGLARGSNEGVPLRAQAFDLTLLAELPGRWAPTLTLGCALGSGDGDFGDGVDRTFRQSGLHDNNAKFGGVTSLRYYGEVLEPELANLRVRTIGFSLRPRDWCSFDLFWHGYEQDEPSGALIDSGAGEDRRLNLTDKDVGEEWDLVFAWERYEHWELEVNLGVFRPGAAFLGGADDAWGSSLKLKYVF